MTYQELRELAAHWAGFPSANTDPNFIAIVGVLLNNAQLRYGNRYFVPRRYESHSISSTSLLLDKTPYSNGVISVFDRTNKRRLPIYTPYEADNEFPDRFDATPDQPKVVVFDSANPTELGVFPQPLNPVELVVLYAYVPPRMERGEDHAWDGQFNEYQEIIAIAAALDYVERRLGEDSAELRKDENPYGPLNAPNWLRKKLAEKEVELQNALYRFGNLPTADAWGDWRSPGYSF